MVRHFGWVLAASLLGCGLESYEPIGEVGDELRGERLNDAVRDLAAAQGLYGFPGADRYDHSDLPERDQQIIAERTELGRFLFNDHALSGVEQTSCGTCHGAAFHFADGRNIARGVFCSMASDGSQIFCEEAPPAGEGGNVTGPDRSAPLNSRNTPSAMNASLFPRQMWNGRFRFVDSHSTDVDQLDASLGFQFPAPEGVMFTRSLLTGQAHIPVTEAVEMTGDFPNFGMPFAPRDVLNDQIRDRLAERISNMPAYRALFESAYGPGTQVFPQDPTIEEGDPIPYLAIADAMAHFQEQDLLLTSAPWDYFLHGEDEAMSESAKRGALVFLGRGRCSSCHGGEMFSDFENHNIGVPQVGPGTGFGDASDPEYLGLRTWDFGLEEVSGNRADRFKFRTPPLRGVALTAPYMHNGAYARLEDAIRHHIDPRRYYQAYDISQIEEDMQLADGLKPLGPVFDERNPVVVGPGTANHYRLSQRDIEDLVAFMIALTDPRMHDLPDLQPETLPSGLPADVAGPRRFPLYGAPTPSYED